MASRAARRPKPSSPPAWPNADRSDPDDRNDWEGDSTVSMSDGQTILEQAAWRYEAAANELERAVGHLRTAARHYREQEIPRGCAHAWAAHGHIVTARQ